MSIQKYLKGTSAVKIAESIEQAVRDGILHGGAALPTVRAASKALRVSPATVASAYQVLRLRGLILTEGRRGTRVSHRPVHGRRPPSLPPGARNLYDGNPDLRLLPDFAQVMRRIDPSPRLYGEPPHDADFVRLAREEFAACGVGGEDVCVVHGAMDGLERVLTEHLRPLDRIAVEDPQLGNIYDLLTARGLSLRPCAVDQEGLLPDPLERACRAGAKAVLITPRAQNPTGAALSERRCRELRAVLDRFPDVLLIEDDHAALITDVPLFCLHDGGRSRWAHLRSFSKPLNPDLRLAVMTADPLTLARVLDRLVVGERWVSHLAQRVAYVLLSDSAVRAHLREVASIYTLRRRALLDALAERSVDAFGSSGFNAWIPVCEETPVVQSLLAKGWAVGAGERFRLNSPPAIRITAAALEPHEAPGLAADVAAVLGATPCAPMV